MPKQIKDKNKSTRMKYALDAIEHHGRCSHKEISTFVANKIDADPDLSSFKKAIHNDIKDLIKDHLIGIEYFMPSGEPIPLGEEEEHKNKRTQYFIIGGEAQINGGKLLKKFNAFFRPQKLSSPTWTIKKLSSLKDFNSMKVGMILNFNGFHYILETNKDELPCRIAVSRNSDYVISQDVLEDQFGKRTSLLLLPWMFLSSSKNDKFCHFIIDLTLDGNSQIHIKLEFIQGKSQSEDDFITKMNNIELAQVDNKSLTTSIDEALKVQGTIGIGKIEILQGEHTSIHQFSNGYSSGLNKLPAVVNFGPRNQIIIADFQKLDFPSIRKSA